MLCSPFGAHCTGRRVHCTGFLVSIWCPLYCWCSSGDHCTGGVHCTGDHLVATIRWAECWCHAPENIPLSATPEQALEQLWELTCCFFCPSVTTEMLPMLLLKLETTKSLAILSLSAKTDLNPKFGRFLPLFFPSKCGVTYCYGRTLESTRWYCMIIQKDSGSKLETHESVWLPSLWSKARCGKGLTILCDCHGRCEWCK